MDANLTDRDDEMGIESDDINNVGQIQVLNMNQTDSSVQRLFEGSRANSFNEISQMPATASFREGSSKNQKKKEFDMFGTIDKTATFEGDDNNSLSISK